MLSYYAVLALPKRLRNGRNKLSLNDDRPTRTHGMSRKSMNVLVALMVALVCGNLGEPRR